MIDVSVVIPCFNEEKTVASCIQKATESFGRSGLTGEVIVVDNGSQDRTAEVSAKAGAVVVQESVRGYGSALRKGIEAASGKYIVMGDGDNTYDFTEVDAFVMKLKEGYDFVIGSRFRGKIMPEAMTWSHRYIGNPILSGILRFFFGGKVSDAHCGLRAFTKEAYQKMNLHTTGMEFASEMVIHSLKRKLRIAEIPITYYARLGQSKLASFRDAWRHIRFMLLYSPTYMFLVPGLVIFLPSFVLTVCLVFGPVHVFGRAWDIHPMVIFSMFTLLGWQILSLGLSAKTFAAAISLEEEEWVGKLLKTMTLERLILFGLVLIAAGVALLARIFYVWYLNDFGALREINTGVLALTMTVMGFQTIFTAFLTSVLQIRYE